MIRLLFLCTTNATASQIAAGFARAREAENVDVSSGGCQRADQVHPMAVQVMAEVGIDISGQSPTLFSNLSPRDIDVVVTLCTQAALDCPLLLQGHPIQVNWNLPDPVVVEGSPRERLDVFRRMRDKISRLVDELFDRGYLKALWWANDKANLILNTFSEGIIAHDMNRHITFFNAAAEAITGYRRDEVIGRDCHDVFPGNFCGAKCSFCGKPPSFDSAQYAVNFTTKTGEERFLEMSVRAIKDDDGSMHGVLASFRDLTLQHDMAQRLGEIESFAGIIGRDKKMLELFDLIRSVADSNVPVLIQGESGTGKELVAAAVHNEGRRAHGMFVPVNCGALPEGLLESELFGHVRGAFTGAIRDKKGRFELADGGTIFLDEIGDISPAMQVKLLRVVQAGAFERLGGVETIHSDIRIISATNKDLKAEIAAGRFREDLYYRLCVVPIELPPLRQRCGDIPLLVDHIIKRVADEAQSENLSLSPAALDAVLSYEWPGNIRELQNALQFARVKCRGDVIEVNHLPPHLLNAIMGSPVQRASMSRARTFASASAGGTSSPDRPGGHRRTILTAEAVQAVLRQTDGNKAKAARVLGVARATLYRFLKNMP